MHPGGTNGEPGGQLALLRSADLRETRDGAAVGEVAGAGMGGLLLVAAVLLFRRLPAVLALRPLLGPLRSRGSDVLFLGWFGPIGAAALYYVAFSLRETGIEEIWVVGSLIICASLLVHGVSATPLTKLYGRLPKNA